MKDPLNIPVITRPAVDLASCLQNASMAHRHSETSALECGRWLLQAKEICIREGKDWLPELEKTGIPRETARRRMRLAESGITHMGNAGQDESEEEDPNPQDDEEGQGELFPDDHDEEAVQEAEQETNEEPAQQGSFSRYITVEQWNALSKKEKKAALAPAKECAFNSQGDNENIEWAQWSWNPVTGCLHNCPYCYARDIAERFYEQKFEPSLWPDRLKAPHNTTFPYAKAAEWMGHKNVFVCSMADLFGRWVPSEWIDAVLSEVRAASQWNFLFLTKFPIRMAEFDFPENAWVGTTVDCQARVANAEKAFRKVKAGVKWLSIEPLIEPLTFSDLSAFQWVVIGGASRSSQTPEWHPPRAWIQSIEDECKQLGVPYYEKSNLHTRVRGYPGAVWEEASQAPEALRYLPTPGE